MTNVCMCSQKKLLPSVGFSFQIFLWTNIRMLGHLFMPYLIVDLKPAVKRTRFAWPFTNKEIESQKKNAIPEKMRQDKSMLASLQPLERKSDTDHGSFNTYAFWKGLQLSQWVQCFILEAKKKDSTACQSTALYYIVSGLMHHLCLNGKPKIDLFKDSSFCRT